MPSLIWSSDSFVAALAVISAVILSASTFLPERVADGFDGGGGSRRIGVFDDGHGLGVGCRRDDGRRDAVVFIRHRGQRDGIMPGRMTSDGKQHFRNGGDEGVLRAAVMFLAAMARWTTRKLVHQ